MAPALNAVPTETAGAGLNTEIWVWISDNNPPL